MLYCTCEVTQAEEQWEACGQTEWPLVTVQMEKETTWLKTRKRNERIEDRVLGKLTPSYSMTTQQEFLSEVRYSYQHVVTLPSEVR